MKLYNLTSFMEDDVTEIRRHASAQCWRNKVWRDCYGRSDIGAGKYHCVDSILNNFLFQKNVVKVIEANGKVDRHGFLDSVKFLPTLISLLFDR